MQLMFHLVEKWKPIAMDNVKPYYLVSTFGRVYSTYSNTFIIPQPNHSGYLQVGLMTNDGNRVYRKVHRIVMHTFYGFDGDDRYQVNHKDTCKTNNYDHNLEWATPKENVHHAISNNCRSDYIGENNPRATLTNKQVREIYELIISCKYSDDQIANIYKCSKDTIRLIALGNTWTSCFTEQELQAMRSTRKGFKFPVDKKHMVCKYYQDHCNDYVSNYGKAKSLSIEALKSCGMEINDYNISIARALYYRHRDHNITSKFNY